MKIIEKDNIHLTLDSRIGNIPNYLLEGKDEEYLTILR